MAKNLEGTAEKGNSDSHHKPSKVKIWIRELRVPFFTASIIPILLGTSVAWVKYNLFNPVTFVLALIIGVALHAGTNVANDYFDYKGGTDNVNKEFIPGLSGGSRTIQEGLLTPKEILGGSLLLFAIGWIAGILVTLLTSWIALALIILGFISGFFYTAPPFKWAHHGVGEVFVGLNFGLFMVLGAYYVQALTIDTEPIIASLPITLLIAAVLYINEFPDYKADMATGKRTLIVRLGRQTAAKLYPVFILTPYIIVLLSVILGIMPVISLIVFATIKKALVAINVAKQHYDEPMKLIPANVNTIKCHLHFGILLVVNYLITGVLLYLYPISLFPLYLSSLF